MQIFQTSGELAVRSLETEFIEDLEFEVPKDSWFLISPNQYVGADLEPGGERIYIVEFVDGDQSKPVLVTATAFVSGIEAKTTKSVRAERATNQ